MHIPEYLEKLAAKELVVQKKIQREKQAELIRQTLAIAKEARDLKKKPKPQQPQQEATA